MRFIPTIAVTLLILIAVLWPGSQIPSVGIGGFDKLVHFSLFFIWSVAVRYDFSPNFKWPWGWLVGLLFSASTEVLQIFAEDRAFDYWDILFDGIGLSVGLLTGQAALRLLTRISRR
jgi:VanZ family protein